MKRLRVENSQLKEQLCLWQNGTKIPVRGEYYTIDDYTTEMHGWEFANGTAFRYDGTRDKIYNILGSTEEKVVHQHMFCAPYQYDDDDGFGRVGWIKLGLETYELHHALIIDEELLHEYKYLTSEDVVHEGEPEAW